MLKLVIGNKNYSSWSMRPWVLLRHFNVDFEEIRIPLFTETFQQQLAEFSPTLKVPVLIDGDVTIWDSMAICEYVSDRYLELPALPEDPVRRGLCRAYCAEMHGGFFALRQQMPMNCRSRRRITIDDELRSEIARIESLWTEALQANQASNGGLGGTKVCMSQIPGSAAIAIDGEMDDGNGATGRLRATQGTAGQNTNPSGTALGGGGVYSEDNEYTLCYRM
jgi:glutathione S-transferase